MRRLGTMLMAMALALGGAAAQPTAKQPSLVPAQPIEISAAEKLMIRFQGYPELSGEYRIGPDLAVSIPVVGRVPIANLDLPQLEKQLAARVSEITSKTNYVTVEIVAYKPLFVSGYVARPGAIQWMPGMNVLQAVALSGGIYRAVQQGSAEGSGRAEQAMTRIRKGIDSEKRKLSTLARLRAERDGKDRLETPPELVDLVGDAEARSLISAQQVILTSRRASLNAQLAALEQGGTLAAQELEGLVTQKARIDEQLKARREYRAKIQDLLVKGIVKSDLGFEQEMKVSELEEKVVNTAVARARVQSLVANVQREAVLLKQDRQASIEAEIAAVEHDVRQAALDVDGSEAEYRTITGETAKLNGRSIGPRISYTIVRNGSSMQQTVSAQESDLLRPGDVLVVNQETDVGGESAVRSRS